MFLHSTFFLLHRFQLMSRLWRNRLLWILNFKFLFYFSAFINKYCSSYLVIEFCTGKVKQTDIYITYKCMPWPLIDTLKQKILFEIF